MSLVKIYFHGTLWKYRSISNKIQHLVISFVFFLSCFVTFAYMSSVLLIFITENITSLPFYWGVLVFRLTCIISEYTHYINFALFCLLDSCLILFVYFLFLFYFCCCFFLAGGATKGFLQLFLPEDHSFLCKPCPAKYKWPTTRKRHGLS